MANEGVETKIVKIVEDVKSESKNRLYITKNILNKYEVVLDGKCLMDGLTKGNINIKSIKKMLDDNHQTINDDEINNVVAKFKSDIEAEAKAENDKIEAEAKAEKDKLEADAKAEAERLKNDTRIKADIKLDFVKEGNLKKVQFKIVPQDLQKHTVSIYNVNSYPINKLVKLEDKAITEAKAMLKILRDTFSFTANESNVETWIKNDFSSSQIMILPPAMPVITNPIQERQIWLDYRYKNFHPYFITFNEDSIPICNFNFTFLKSLIIGDKQFFTIRINYVDIKNGKEEFIEKDMEISAMTTPAEWIKFITPLSNTLWYDRRSIANLLTEINKDLNNCNPFLEVTVKSADIGWNKEGDRYSTQSVDIFLTPDDNLKGYKVDGNNNLIVSVGVGTTQFIDEDYIKIKDINFTEIDDFNFARTMMYLSDKWIKLTPLIPRLTGFIFMSPFASFVASYIRMVAFLSGTTGYGKTALAKACASFYGNIKDDKQLIAASTSIPKIAFYAHLYKDCIMVLDNVKEGFLSNDEIKVRCDFISKYADNQPREVMGKEARYGRGSLIVTGEEIPQDASTLRKIDQMKLLEPIDPLNDKTKPKVTELMTYTPYFTGVMIRYLKWVMERYGDSKNIGEMIIKATTQPILNDITDRVLRLNYIGFSLFIEFMVDNKFINVNDGKTMLKDHLDSLIEVDKNKLESVSGKTSGQKYINAINSLIKTKEVQIEGILANSYKPTIGKVLRNGDVVIYPDAYPLIRSKTMHYFELPKDDGSVYDQIKNMIKSGEIQGEVSKPVKIGNKTERSITYNPSVFELGNNIKISNLSIAKVFEKTLVDKGIYQTPSEAQIKDLVSTMMPFFNNVESNTEDWINAALTLKGWMNDNNPSNLSIGKGIGSLST